MDLKVKIEMSLEEYDKLKSCLKYIETETDWKIGYNERNKGNGRVNEWHSKFIKKINTDVKDILAKVVDDDKPKRRISKGDIEDIF